MPYITLTQESIASEHICCAFSDEKCSDGYQMKKRWLARELGKGYRFQRLDERAKVFIEYGPAEVSWVPVSALNHMMIGCFWVSGRYKKQGHGKALLHEARDAAKRLGMDGLVSVVGTKKFHFMSDGKWLMRQGFEVCDSLSSGVQPGLHESQSIGGPPVLQRLSKERRVSGEGRSCRLLRQPLPLLGAPRQGVPRRHGQESEPAAQGDPADNHGASPVGADSGHDLQPVLERQIRDDRHQRLHGQQIRQDRQQGEHTVEPTWPSQGTAPMIGQ